MFTTKGKKKIKKKAVKPREDFDGLLFEIGILLNSRIWKVGSHKVWKSDEECLKILVT